MKAMVLAAGLGTRLRPLTDDRPKALVEIGGRTMLELVLSRLQSFGVREAIINVFHFAEMIVAYLKANQNFGMRITISREDELLDTGGGLKKAQYFFAGSNSDEAPFIVHNVDVLSTIDLRRMERFHTGNRALATLAVQDRITSRYLMFDDSLQLCGRQSGGNRPELVRGCQKIENLAFCGIHIVSPRMLRMMIEENAFSIVNSYLRVAAQGEKIMAFRADEFYWRDLGKPNDLIEAAHDLKENTLLQ